MVEETVGANRLTKAAVDPLSHSLLLSFFVSVLID